VALNQVMYMALVFEYFFTVPRLVLVYKRKSFVQFDSPDLLYVVCGRVTEPEA
jgi:hypothetical protein